MALGAAPSIVGVRFEQLGTGGADDQQRDLLGSVGQVLQEREHGVVGPVQVLETSTVGRCSAMCSRNRHQAVNSSSRSAVRQPRSPSSGRRRWRNQGRSSPSGRKGLELGVADGRGVGLQDPGVGLDDLSERPERDALAVRQASTLAPGDELGLRRCSRRVPRRSGSCPGPGSPTTVTSWGRRPPRSCRRCP